MVHLNEFLLQLKKSAQKNDVSFSSEKTLACLDFLYFESDQWSDPTMNASQFK